MSPAFINLGRQPELPSSLRRELEKPRLLEQGHINDWISRMKRIPLTQDIVFTELEKSSKRQVNYYNKRRRDVKFKRGDLVWRKTHVLSSASQNFVAKLAPAYEGPFQIAKVHSSLVYDLEGDGLGRSNTKVHVQDLKPYVAPVPSFEEDSPNKHVAVPEAESLDESKRMDNLNKHDSKTLPATGILKPTNPTTAITTKKRVHFAPPTERKDHEYDADNDDNDDNSWSTRLRPRTLRRPRRGGSRN